MSRRVRILAMAATLVAVALGVGSVSTLRLYQVALTQQRERLVEVAQGRARLIEAMARFDAQHSASYPGGAFEATLSQLREAHERFAGFGRTGEFVLARREGGQMVFLLRHRGDTVDAPAPVPFASSLAEPMRRAVNGEAGTMIGLDYRGVRVLAAYEPVAELDAGLVAKIDLAEVRAPYVADAVIAGAIGLLLVLVGVVLTRTLGGGLVKELERAEAGEQRHLEWWRLATHAGNLGVFDVELASGKVDVSPELLILLAYQTGDVGSTLEWWAERIHPADRDTTLAAFNGFLEDPHAVPPSAFRLRTGQGGHRWLLCAARVVERNTDGAPERVVGVATDVTALQETQEALATREAHLRAAQEVGRIGSWEWSAEDGSVWWSDEMYRITGKEPGDYEPSVDGFLEVVHEEDREEARRVAALSLQEGRPAEFDFRIGAARGEIRWYHGLSSPEVAPDGRVVRALGFVQDVTHGRAQAEMLRQAQKMEVVGFLTDGIAHDFNNILTAIIANADLGITAIRDHRAPSAELLSDIRTAGRLGADLIRQLMAFSRRAPLDLRVTSVRDALADTARILQRLIPASIAVTLRCDADTAHVRLDSAALQQILLNLAMNARDAMPDGGALAVECTRGRVAGDASVRICVRDTGTGMDPDTLEHAFDPFFTTKTADRGTGLGLAMARALTELQGGTIDIESGEGVGTVFTLSFPEVDEPVREPVAWIEASDATSGRGAILLVEDEDAIRAVAERILRRAGYDVRSSPDGRHALEAIEAGDDIDLVISDVVMPGMGGLELFRLVEDRPGCPRFLFMSGYSSLDELGKSDVRGLRFLRKPWGAHELLQAVRDALDEPAAGAVSGAAAPNLLW